MRQLVVVQEKNEKEAQLSHWQKNAGGCHLEKVKGSAFLFATSCGGPLFSAIFGILHIFNVKKAALETDNEVLIELKSFFELSIEE